MQSKRPAVRYGRVVYAWIKDHRGFEKLRPALVLTPDDLIEKNQILIVAAITTTFPEPPQKNEFPLPWDAKGSASTRLRSRSAVVLDWQSQIAPEDVVGFGGDVPAKLMLEIEHLLDKLI